MPREISKSDEEALRARFGLSRRYVMYTGGIDFRKNIDGLIEAYAKLSAELRAKFQLAIVCSVHPEERAKISRQAAKCGLRDDELVLTGFVPDDDLVNLYNLCHAFVFPSLYEGFGLPALEAMACGAAVIGSNKSSIPEVIGRQDALFDPSRPADITEALERLLLALEGHGGIDPQAEFVIAQRLVCLEAADHLPARAPVRALHLTPYATPPRLPISFRRACAGPPR